MNEVKNVKKLLTDKKCSLKIAESFTGGYITSRITSLQGASAFLAESLIVYSNKSKTSRLGVNEAVIEAFGAVSYITVREMLAGLIKSGCDYAIATSGNASNPIESLSKKGECFIGVASKNLMHIYYCNLKGTRKQIIKKGSTIALKALIELVKKSHQE